MKGKIKFELWCVAAFVAVHLAAPLVIGELYPFTISPMFCDKPTQCCTYEVTTTDGRPLPAERFNLHLVYDGNPPGLGMGIKPVATVHPFGEVPPPEAIQTHVETILKQASDLPAVVVIRHHLVHENHRIHRQTQKWIINRPNHNRLKDVGNETNASALESGE